MVLYDIYSDCVHNKYKVPFISKATLIVNFVTLLSFILPFLVAYRSQGFWLQTSTFTEQPDIHFKYQYLLIIETKQIGRNIICTSFDSLLSSNNVLVNNCPVIKVREEDTNRDAINDYLNIEFQVALHNNDSVVGVALMLLFDYRLYSHVWLEMESASWIQIISNESSGKLDLVADLRLYQRQPLKSRGRDLRFNKSIIAEQKLFNYKDILMLYNERNITTRLENVYWLWYRGRAANENFYLNAKIYYPEENIIFTPAFWHTMKFAWAQYLSLLFISILISRRIKKFILENRIVWSVKEMALKKDL